MNNLSAGIALSLLAAFASVSLPPPAESAALEIQEAGAQRLMRDILAASPTFRALTRDSLSEKWDIRMTAPAGEEAAKTLYDQSRAMRDSIIEVDIEDGADRVATINRLIDAMTDAWQVQQGLNPYVLGINPYQVVFGMEPALGAQAMTIKLAVLMEADAALGGNLLKETAYRSEEFAAALAAYREAAEDKDGKPEMPALLSPYKAMLRGENNNSHLRAGRAVSGLQRLAAMDATEQERKSIRFFYIQSLPLHRLGTVPGTGSVFDIEAREKVWPALGDRHLTGPELADAFGTGMEKWYKDNYGRKYGRDGAITDDDARNKKIRAIMGLATETDRIATLFGDIAADREAPLPLEPKRPSEPGMKMV